MSVLGTRWVGPAVLASLLASACTAPAHPDAHRVPPTSGGAAPAPRSDERESAEDALPRLLDDAPLSHASVHDIDGIA